MKFTSEILRIDQKSGDASVVARIHWDGEKVVIDPDSEPGIVESIEQFGAYGRDGPTTPEADKYLESKGVYVIPDFLANAGGVTCSYFEQVQSNINYFWTKEEVLTRLDEKMTAAFHAVNDLSSKRKLYMRDAAYVIAISRVAEACRERGWI